MNYGEVPEVWHTRVIVGQLVSSGTRLLTLSPDGDRYFEDFSGEDGDIVDVRWCTERGEPPPGIDRARVYCFRVFPSGAELAIQYRLGGEDAAREDRALGVVGPEAGAPWLLSAAAVAPMLRGGRLPRPAAPLAGGGVMGLQAGAVLRGEGSPSTNWVYAEDGAREGVPFKRGDQVDLDGSEVVRGSRGVINIGGGQYAAIADLGDADAEEFRASLSHHDGRLQRLERDTAHRRHKPWRRAVELMEETSVTDWPVPGPRTVLWCCQFLSKRTGGPVDWDRFWRSVHKLNLDMWGVAEHEASLRALEHACCWDQLEVCNLAAFEVMMRRVQLIEYYYYEAARRDEASRQQGGKRHGATLEESAIFSGQNRDYGECMVAPSLIDHVSKEVERDASIMKQIRKAREERALQKKSGQ